MFETGPGGEVVYFAVDPRDKGRVVHEGVRRMCLGWQDYSSLQHEPLKTFRDHDLIIDQSEATTVVYIEVHVPSKIKVENRGFALMLHHNIEPAWIKGVFEYTKIQNEIAGV